MRLLSSAKKLSEKGLAGLKSITKKHKRITFVSAFAIIGCLLILITNAAALFVSIEPENSTLNGVSTISDSSASGGKAVQFGSKDNGLTIVMPKAELDQLKSEVATNGYKQTYWNYVKNTTSSKNRSRLVRTSYTC